MAKQITKKYIFQQGFIEITIIIILLILKYLDHNKIIVLMLTLSYLFMLIWKVKIINKYELTFVYVILFYFLQINTICNILVIFCIFNLSLFKNQNFFECSIFAIIFGLIEAYPYFQSQIIEYLIKCLQIQIKIILPFTLIFGLNNHYIILITNVTFALNAILIQKLHLQLLNSNNLGNLLYLGTISIIVLIVFVAIIGQFNIPNIVKRKIFHLPPLILFPILNELTRDLFLVALAGIFYILFVLELIRIFYQTQHHNNDNLIDKFLTYIWKWMSKFIDQRDKFLWLTHLSLFLGMTLTYFTQSNKITRNASIIIPIGDAFAAIIGYNYGKHKINGGRKSYQGLLAFIIVSILIFNAFGYLLDENLLNLRLWIIIIILGIFQALSEQIDNLLLPLLFAIMY